MAQLLKVHGSQNQFFLLDQTTLARPLSDPELRALGLQLCDPATGILGGADGLLVVNDSNNPAASGQMRVINADGSEASMCGNGLRTVARYLAEKTNQTRFQVETMKADLTVAYHDDFFPSVPGYAVEISPVRFNKEALPFDQVGHERLLDTLVPEFVPGWRFSALAVPNPHLIAFVSDEELAARRAEQDKKGWKPAAPRARRVSTALKAYALLATSADKGAVRNKALLDG